MTSSPRRSDSVSEFLSAFREHYVAAMAGGAGVIGTLYAAFAPTAPASALAGILAVGCGVFAAHTVWAAERRAIIELERQMDPRPFITVEYNDNATEEDPHAYETLTFHNVGAETALSIDIVTIPATFGTRQWAPYLPLGKITKLEPREEVDKAIFGLSAFVHAIRKQSKEVEVRVPLEVTYSDCKGRSWRETHALVGNVFIRIENITGRPAPLWTPISREII